MSDRLTVVLYELNMLLRHTGAHVDIVERDGYTEIVVSERPADDGR